MWNDPVTLQATVLTWGRAFAAFMAIGLALLAMLLLQASHPPALASALLVALGSVQQPRTAGLLLLSVVILTVLAEALRRVRRGQMPTTAVGHIVRSGLLGALFL